MTDLLALPSVRNGRRLAVISHTYVVAASRGKLDRLAERCGIESLLVIPTRWRNRDVDHVIQADAPTGARYQTAIIPAWMAGYGSLLLYSPSSLFSLLREFQPDVIYVEEEPWSLATLELGLLSAALRKPFVFFTWENLDRRLPVALRLVQRVVLRLATAAVAGSQQAKRRLERSGFRRPVAVIPQLGFDGCCENAGASGDKTFAVGYAGRLVPQKGIMVLLEAVARLPGARLLLVGRGPLKGQIAKRASALGLLERLELRDGVAHHEVPNALAQMSVLVLPSLTTRTWKEQFGHVLIEAMACGVPVVGTDSGAIPEVIDDAGLVVPEGDVEALVHELTRLKEDSALREAMAAKGKARVEAHYTNGVIADRLAQFLMAL